MQINAEGIDEGSALKKISRAATRKPVSLYLDSFDLRAHFYLTIFLRHPVDVRTGNWTWTCGPGLRRGNLGLHTGLSSQYKSIGDTDARSTLVC